MYGQGGSDAALFEVVLDQRIERAREGRMVGFERTVDTRADLAGQARRAPEQKLGQVGSGLDLSATAVRDGVLHDIAQVVERLTLFTANRRRTVGEHRPVVELEPVPRRFSAVQADHPAPLRDGQRAPVPQASGQLGMYLRRAARQHDHERPGRTIQREAEPLRQRLVLVERRLLGDDPAQQRAGGDLLGAPRAADSYTSK
jgi:hypothetical protein